MKEKILSIPCPHCGGSVHSNGEVVCKKCGTRWVSFTRVANDFLGSPGYTDTAVYNFAAIVYQTELSKILIPEKLTGALDIRAVIDACTHLERASIALKMMIDQLAETTDGKK